MVGNRFNPDINQDLLNLIEGFQYEPYRVVPTSGYRPGDPRQHGRGNAIDIQLVDPKTGIGLANYQNAANFPAYQAYANALYQYALQTNPALAQKLRWGGYFGGGADKYGALDLMHFDIAGGPGGIPMAGGSWTGGLNAEQAKLWNIAAGGGLGSGSSGDDAVMRAFLNTIASGESPGYDVLYGGEKFSDYSHHPGRSMPIFDPNHPGQVIGHTDVAGRYQFKGSTWDELAKKYGYKDFTPATQDIAAWQYAQDIYKQQTGGDLYEALNSGDPGRINAAAQILNKTWTSLPGGKEQAKGYGTKTFADIYNQQLKSGAGTGAGTSTGTPVAATNPYTAPKQAEKKNWLEEMGKGVSGMASAIGKGSAISSLPPQPGAAVAAAEQRPTLDPNAVEGQRQRLAQAMARLNQGALWS